MQLGEERKVVSVLFVDLVGFTATSESADPEDVRGRLRPYHARVKEETERFGGTVEKFVGDAVMAVFGAPIAHEDDPERAVNAALRILDAIQDLNDEQPGLNLSVRGAVNTGQALVVLNASAAEGEAMVAGDVVNTAARLQNVAPVGGIVVGATTYAATRDLFEYEELEPVSVKGKAEPVPLWHARSARRRFGVDVESQAKTPLIARDDELALLRSTHSRTLRDRSPQLVTITGEPGVGKTRLTAEFRSLLDDAPELVFWRQGRSLPYGEGITYWALGEMIKGQAGILESDSPEQAAAKLTIAVGEITDDSSERDWFEGSLAPLVGAGEATAASDREETFTAWRLFLEGIASRRPLVLVFEDLHWADDALLSFIEHLVDWSTDVPLLVVCTARPELFERRADWGGGKRNSTTISLSPLGSEDTARLVAALLEQAVLPAETQERLLEHAGGNPLYAEEFVRMLGDQGGLNRTFHDRDIRVPDTVQALIAARLDTLAPERKALLQNAAVIGKVFWGGAAASMSGADESSVRADLHELARKELVRPARASSVQGQAEYSFSHAIVRDVAYGQIPRGDRSRKHAAAAAWIERMAGERVIDHAELLAHHYEQALDLARAAGLTAEAEDLSGRARRFLELAGDRATTLDLARATAYFRRALKLFEPEDPNRAHILVKAALADPDSLEGDAELEEALDLYRQNGDELREGWVLVHLSNYAFIRGDGERADRLVIQAIELLERFPPGEELATAYARRAGVLAVGGRSRECRDVAKQALRVIETLGLKRIEARARQYYGIARYELGDPDGLDEIRHALQLAREIGELTSVAVGYSNLATLTLTRSAQEALELYDEGIAFGKRRGMIGSVMWLRAERTWCLYDLGRWDELADEVDEIDAWSRGRGRGYIAFIALPQKALVLLQRGHPADAQPLADDALPRAREARDPQVLLPALAAAAALAAARGDHGAASALVREAQSSMAGLAWTQWARYLSDFVEVAVTSDDSVLAQALVADFEAEGERGAAALASARARIAETSGDHEEALALYERALTAWGEQGSIPAHARSLFGAGRCLLALRRPNVATARLREAREFFVSLDAHPAAAAVDDALTRARSLTA
jgi:class 3 adenylate cyclase/tetratricopeptide (TPR) repeat protein